MTGAVHPKTVADGAPADRISWSERLRKPLSAAFVVMWLIVAVLFRPAGFDARWREVSEHAGGLLLIGAALGRIWAHAYIGSRKNLQLCCEGPYSLTRNPLYFFSFLGVVGAGLALQIPLLAVAGGMAFLAYYRPVIRAEEGRLAALFGAGFAAYRSAVPRFWPRLRGWRNADALVLSPRLFARTLGDVFWFLAAILFIEWLEWAKLRDLWPTLALPQWV
jgi:protein-S-isoprenylcysteine O-methyltransferase Ste14